MKETKKPKRRQEAIVRVRLMGYCEDNVFRAYYNAVQKAVMELPLPRGCCCDINLMPPGWEEVE
jgi:hypothetical protein